MGPYISLTLVHGLPERTASGLPQMDHPEICANINSTTLEPRQKMRLSGKRTIDQFRYIKIQNKTIDLS